MNILFIAHEAELKGATRSLLEIIEELKIRGNYGIHVLTNHKTGPFIDELNKIGVNVIYRKYYWWYSYQKNILKYIDHLMKWYFYKDFVNDKVAKELVDYISCNDINIVHTNSSVVDMGARIKRLSSIAHVWHIREFGDDDFGIKPVIPKTIFHRVMNKYTDAFVFVSKSLSEHFPWIDSNKKYVIYNGVSRRHILHNRRCNGNGINILMASAISETKGHQVAVDACIELLRRGYEDFTLYFAGGGKIEVLDRYNELGEHLHCLGFINDMTLIREMMDIEIVCSKKEAFGRVTAEAMLSGLPVVGSNSGGTAELIQHGMTGLLFEQGNSLALADALAKLIDDKALRIRMGRKARELALHNFTIDLCVDKVTSIYDAISAEISR